jgi:hypothetical protein
MDSYFNDQNRLRLEIYKAVYDLEKAGKLSSTNAKKVLKLCLSKVIAGEWMLCGDKFIQMEFKDAGR